MSLLMGAVAYDAKVVTIWSGFRAWLSAQGLPFDFVLYSNYERQVEDLVDGRIHAAWNSPLAWIRARRLAAARGTSVRALAMRDTDRDLRSVVVVRGDSDIRLPADLKGKTVATGAVDSPQATLLPLHHLRELGVEPVVRRFDVGVGLHGDHVGGERDAARALVSGEVAAACMIDANHLLFEQEGTLPAGSTRILTATAPYDHCNMTVVASAPAELVDEFGRLLAGMSYADPEVRPLLDLEGLKAWKPGRESGYAELEAAVDGGGFYDGSGRVTAPGYTP
ncbi:phosphate/phosphite/phosphonate ABC transporter substrate-binding protein [Sphaerisporangium fuscum]|uniref:phosphate/phosphite/phosphonate ABC transporter substrate-binding protein n=1 Tax=Sphaerisporangium fuscum TaxID=2835868 RepID=UPI001BDD077D|nr:PhnD/SsuA/transferrin family substrate-binding protein [Sphaerisporangium fuscum]